MNSQLHTIERRVARRPAHRGRSALAGVAITIGLVAGALTPVRADAAPAPSNVHIVKPGENLYRIALNLQVSLDSLLAANGLQANSLILPGQQLVVPAGARASQPAAAPVIQPAKAPTSTVQIATSGIYVVKPGDGLYQIAQKLGVKLDDLLAANNLKISSVIVPGQPLKVPSSAKAFNATSPSAAGQTATRTGTAPPAPPAPAPTTPAIAPAPHQANLKSTPSAKAAQALAFAQSQLGKPYLFGASGPDAYDCSGLIVAAYRSVGVKLPHHSATQATYGVAVDWKTQPILPGDLVFAHRSSGGNLGHVGIAIDSTHYIHAPRSGDVVKVTPIPSPTVIQAVRRIVPA